MSTMLTALLLIGAISYIGAQTVTLPPMLLNAETVYQSGDNSVTGLPGWRPYDCRRAPGLPCSGNGVCVDGECVSCTGGFTGYDCSVSVAVGFTGPEACSAASLCVNAVCYNSGSVETCLCNPIFTGPFCNISRASVECRSDDMKVIMYPQRSTATFEGAYAVQESGTSVVSDHIACSGHTRISTRFIGGQYFETTFSENASPTLLSPNPCSSFLTVTPVTGGSVTGAQNVCYDVRLMYWEGLALDTDDVFKFCCRDIADTRGGVTVDNSASGGGANVDGSISIINSRLAYTATRLEINPGDPVTVGDDISFVMTLDVANRRYDDFRVVTCRAFPGNLTIVSGQCPDTGALSVITGMELIPIVVTPGQPSITEIWVNIKAYKGTTSNVVTLECDCDVCVNACPAATVCPGFQSQLNFGRKKRQADTPAETYTTRTTFIVLDSNMASTKTPSVPNEPCYQSTVFIVIATVFGVLLLVALVVSVVVCMRYAARGRKNNSPPTSYINAGMTKA